MPTTRATCSHGSPPTNSMAKQMAPSMAAVEKSEGKMSAHTRPMPAKMGATPCQKSCSLSRRTCNCLATHMTRASLAKSEVCTVNPMKGILIQRRASLMSVPKSNVNTSAATANTMTRLASLLKYLKWMRCTPNMTSHPKDNNPTCLNRNLALLPSALYASVLMALYTVTNEAMVSTRAMPQSTRSPSNR